MDGGQKLATVEFDERGLPRLLPGSGEPICADCIEWIRWLHHYEELEPVSRPRFGEGDFVLRAGTQELYQVLAARLTGLPAAGMVSRLNEDVIQDSRLEEFLFGATRIPLDRVRQPLRELQGNRCFYCEKPIGQEADVDHFLPWARHPDNGIENLVVTDPRCNNDKRDFLAAAQHVERWRWSRFGAAVSQLADIAKSTNWETHPQRTFGAVRSIYLRMSSEQKLWLRGRDFVNADRRALANALGSTDRPIS